MNRAARGLFLVFYLTATIVVTAERSARLMDGWVHASVSTETHVKDSCEPRTKCLPHFSHATKTGPVLAFHPTPKIQIAPAVTVREFHERPVVLAFCVSDERVAARAPPAAQPAPLNPSPKPNC